MQPKYEYKTLHLPMHSPVYDDLEIDDMLNQVGADGWELLAVTPLLKDNATVALIHHFRRTQNPERKAGFSFAVEEEPA